MSSVFASLALMASFGTSAAGTPATAAEAEAMGPPPVQSHHVTVNSSRYPWSSLAKLFNSVGGACTGAVIGRARVLTAAHCVYAFRTRRFLPAEALHVLVGYDRGGYRTHARVVRYHLGPGYDPPAERQTSAADWVVLDLAEPLPLDIRPLSLAPAPPIGSIMLAGFAQDRAFVLTADEDCRLTGPVDEGKLISHDCMIQPGDSGAPLLRGDTSGAEATILGIAIGIWHVGTREVGIAAPISPDLLKAAAPP